MPFRPKLRARLALAERTIAEALRVLAPAKALDESRSAQIMVPPDPIADRSVLVLADERTLRAQPPASAVMVYEPTADALSQFRFDVGDREWEQHAASAAEQRVGAIRGGVLIALASMDRPEGHLARIRVLVSPAFRQRGLGHLVLHRLTTRMLQEGWLPWATLTAYDLTARALARTTGFVSLARQLSPPRMSPSFG